MLGFVTEKLLNQITNEIRSGYERTIMAQERTITLVRNELTEERIAHGETRQLLTRALRLEPAAPVSERATPHIDSVGRTKSWGKLKAELEIKHRRKPEDATAEYWEAKNAAMEAESKALDAQIHPEADDANEISKAI